MKKLSLYLVSSLIGITLLSQCNVKESTSDSTAIAKKTKEICPDKSCCSAQAILDKNQPLTYQGEAGGIGEGKHIVLIAADHEYRSEETIPALARILAKQYGFKCTVLFSVDKEGFILPGHSNIPHMDKLDEADSLILFARFLNLPDEQMTPLINYLKAGKPIIGLRTSTHAFKNDGKGTYAHFNWQAENTNFGRQILGEGWAGHYGKNHKQSTSLEIVPEQANHPILTGVTSMWVECGGYMAAPREPSVIIAMTQPLNGMTPDSPKDPKMPPVPGLWTTTYSYDGGAEGQVITSTSGASEDIQHEGYRRMLINAALYQSGLTDQIKANSNIDFVGAYKPTTFRTGGHVTGIKPLDYADYATSIPLHPKKATAPKKNKDKDKKNAKEKVKAKVKAKPTPAK